MKAAKLDISGNCHCFCFHCSLWSHEYHVTWKLKINQFLFGYTEFDILQTFFLICFALKKVSNHFNFLKFNEQLYNMQGYSRIRNNRPNKYYHSLAMIVDVFDFNNVPGINLDVCCTLYTYFFLYQYLMDSWTIQEAWKYLVERAQKHSLHSFFPLCK